MSERREGSAPGDASVRLDALRRAVLAWITAWPAQPTPPWSEPERLRELALALHGLQRETIAPFGAYCAARSAIAHTSSPAVADDPTRLPCVPVAAFKRARLYRHAPTYVARFETSGTSDGQPGVVALPDTALYDASLRASFHTFVVPDAPLRMAASPGAGPFRVLSLVPPATLRPRSSLGHMVGVVAETWGLGPATWMLRPAEDPALETEGQLDLTPLLAAAERDEPVLVLATSIALAMVREHWPQDLQIRLPPGSRLMDTGGPKGRRLTLSRDDQHAWLVRHLGLHPALIVGELGMTELASQRYEPTARAHLVGDVADVRAYVGPPWLLSVVLSPGDLTPLPPGEVGLVAHMDLANVDTCAFVLTADRGRMVPVGSHHGLVLEGRVPGAEWRGCGLDVEGLLGA